MPQRLLSKDNQNTDRFILSSVLSLFTLSISCYPSSWSLLLSDCHFSSSFSCTLRPWLSVVLVLASCSLSQTHEVDTADAGRHSSGVCLLCEKKRDYLKEQLPTAVLQCQQQACLRCSRNDEDSKLVRDEAVVISRQEVVSTSISLKGQPTDSVTHHSQKGSEAQKAGMRAF